MMTEAEGSIVAAGITAVVAIVIAVVTSMISARQQKESAPPPTSLPPEALQQLMAVQRSRGCTVSITLCFFILVGTVLVERVLDRRNFMLSDLPTQQLDVTVGTSERPIVTRVVDVDNDDDFGMEPAIDSDDQQDSNLPNRFPNTGPTGIATKPAGQQASPMASPAASPQTLIATPSASPASR
jgi:hypothetical protein